MKVTVLGGGGVRAPLFVNSVLRRAQMLDITELCLMDMDGDRLGLMGGLCRVMVRQAGDPLRLTLTTSAREALESARYVVTTIRVGKEDGRILDERIALRHGVLGQETTGPGGLAMAMRSIPVILHYAEMIEQICPGAWMFNFTNPAGLVTQALRSRGFDRVVGICDGANTAQRIVAQWLKLPHRELRAEVFGLNHLSWTRHILHDGQDVLAPLLGDPRFLAESPLRAFAPELVQRIGMWLNEYLYYYYHAEQALASIQSDAQTRGEQIKALNEGLLGQLRAMDIERDPEAALQAYYLYEHRRHSTYMPYAYHTSAIEDDETVSPPSDSDGYAGVALDIVEAFETGEPIYTALNVPNDGAIACMRPDDVVEVSCRIDRRGIHTLPIGEIPEAPMLLMQTVKRYERLAVQAIEQRSRALAVDALMAHPLVLSYSRATALVGEYLRAHAPYVGEWH